MDEFKVSSFCSVGGCVEVHIGEEYVFMRASDEPGNVKRYTREEWIDFVSRTKADA